MIILIFSIYLLNYLIFAVQLQDCNTKQGQYFENSQVCQNCSEHCSNCLNSESCLVCESTHYLDFQKGKCSQKCQDDFYALKYFNVCLKCQIQNCKICNQDNTCKECKNDLSLSEDKKICFKKECFENPDLYAQIDQNICKYYCPEGFNQKRVCTSYNKSGSQEQFQQPIELFDDCKIKKQLLYNIENKMSLIVVCEQIIIFYNYEDLTPYFKQKFQFKIVDLTLIDNYLFFVLESKIYFARFNLLTAKLDYLNVDDRNCSRKEFQENYVICYTSPLVYLYDPKEQIQIKYLYNKLPTLQIYSSNRILQDDYFVDNQEEYSYPSNIENDGEEEDFTIDYTPKLYKDSIKYLETSSFEIIDKDQNQDTNKDKVFVLKSINKAILKDKNYIYYLDLGNEQQILLYGKFTANEKVSYAFSYKNKAYFLLTKYDSIVYLWKVIQTDDKSYKLINLGLFISLQRNLVDFKFINQQAIIIVTDKSQYQIFIYFLIELQIQYIKGSFIVNVENYLNGIQQNNGSQKYLYEQDDTNIEEPISISNNFLIVYVKKKYLKVIPFDEKGFQIEKLVIMNYSTFNLKYQEFLFDSSNQFIIFTIRSEIFKIQIKKENYLLKIANSEGSKLKRSYGLLKKVQYDEIIEAIYFIYQYGFKIIFDNNNKETQEDYIESEISEFAIRYGYFFFVFNSKIIVFDTILKKYFQFNTVPLEATQLQQKENYLVISMNNSLVFYVFIIYGYDNITGYTLGKDAWWYPNQINTQIYSSYNRLFVCLMGSISIYKIQNNQLIFENQYNDGEVINKRYTQYSFFLPIIQQQYILTFNQTTQQFTQVNIQSLLSQEIYYFNEDNNILETELGSTYIITYLNTNSKVELDSNLYSPISSPRLKDLMILGQEGAYEIFQISTKNKYSIGYTHISMKLVDLKNMEKNSKLFVQFDIADEVIFSLI